MDGGEDLDGWLEMVPVGTCPACAKLDQWNDDDKREKPTPGTQWAVVNIRDYPELAPDRKE